MIQQQKSFENQTYGQLYLVPTPIGNLEDMTFRAVKTLQEVDLIASEDTRHTQKLLNHFAVQVPQKSLHEHNHHERVPQLIALLKQGQSIAQVSDAGMPSISDPGHELVKACLQEGISVIALPGASAGVTALIASGLSPSQFYFHGFLPRKKQEQLAVFEALQNRAETLIFYESPFRLKKTLQHMGEVFNGQRQVVVCRELTKKHETYIRGHLQEVMMWAENTEIKGECCLLVSGIIPQEQVHLAQEEDVLEGVSIEEQVAWFVANGYTQKEAIKVVAKRLGKAKQEVYKVIHGG